MAEPQQTWTIDDTTRASDPGRIGLSRAKLRRLRPGLCGPIGLIRWLGAWVFRSVPETIRIREHLRFGDSRAAVVVSASPLLVAAYTDELDCVAILRFPEHFSPYPALKVGDRLLTVNTYKRGDRLDADLIPGPGSYGRWPGFHPIIAEFVSDDLAWIDARKRQIPEAEWARALAFGLQYLAQRPGTARDGRPIFSAVPARTPPDP